MHTPDHAERDGRQPAADTGSEAVAETGTGTGARAGGGAAAAGARPTRVRYGLLGLLFLVTALNYLDRSNLSVAAPHLKDEFDLSATELGLLFSLFSWSYVLVQIPGGWLLDRLGPKLAYGYALVGWSLVTVATGFARSLNTLLGLRIALGLSEAPTFPANNKFVSTWFPSSERARATGVYSAGQYLGLALALPLLSWIIAGSGWREMFVITGAVGLVLAVFWFWKAHSLPAEHPRINEAELALTKETETAPARVKASWPEIRHLLSHRRLWGMYIGNFAANGVMWFFLSWFPTYLTDEKGITGITGGSIGSVPYVAALVGVLSSGYISDRLLRRGLSRTAARKIPLVCGFVLSGCIVTANFTDSTGLVILIMSIAFFGQGTSALGWTICSEVAPVRSLGLAGGVFNFFTNLGGAISPLIVGVILDRTGSFAVALTFIAGLAMAGLLCYLLLIDRVERLPEPKPAK
ncbi:MFS transporter [Streptomyces sp. NBC_01795]|uniref:MFS transporter n=1 Tax=Streptomyces sp. NBC_01795 TaxID=2975943 RepID=UPI002DD82794|nr:MFS transporter [Streptomyces sp. NBC_01795]WSA96847.1 MFS transporter [Streptomyces sp. NBC_01795]